MTFYRRRDTATDSFSDGSDRDASTGPQYPVLMRDAVGQITAVISSSLIGRSRLFGGTRTCCSNVAAASLRRCESPRREIGVLLDVISVMAMSETRPGEDRAAERRIEKVLGR